jgi:hypothetical protein
MLAIVVAAAVFLYQFRDRLGGSRSVAGVPSPSNSNVPDKADVTAFVPQPGVPEKPEAITSALQSGAAETVGMSVAESTEPVADEAQAVSEVVVRPAPEEDRAVAPRRARKVPAAAPTPGPNPFRTSLAVSDGVSRPVRGPEVE